MIDWLKRSATDPEIALGGQTVPIVLRRHKTARRMTLRLAPDGSEVRVTLPQWARSQEAISFAHARTDWLTEQRARIPERRAIGPGSHIDFRGRTLTIDWDKSHSRRAAVKDDCLCIGGPTEGLETRVRRWMEREALKAAEADILFYCERAAQEPVRVGLSRAQKRWGSCSDGGPAKQRSIRINWRLIQAPDFVRQSVAAHEVAHLVHFDHSPAFHGLLAEIFDGNIAIADRWLKEKGRSLYSNFG